MVRPERCSDGLGPKVALRSNPELIQDRWVHHSVQQARERTDIHAPSPLQSCGLRPSSRPARDFLGTRAVYLVETAWQARSFPLPLAWLRNSGA